MKFYFLAVSVIIMVTACNNNPKPLETSTLLKSDSTFFVQPELPVVIKEEPVPVPVKTVVKKRAVAKNTQVSSASTTNSGSTSGSSTAAAAEKKGWSKTAKGAVIGGVVGAGTGIIVNKRNRLAGGVIGGVVGAGAGAVIGSQMDKKDGRQ